MKRALVSVLLIASLVGLQAPSVGAQTKAVAGLDQSVGDSVPVNASPSSEVPSDAASLSPGQPDGAMRIFAAMPHPDLGPGVYRCPEGIHLWIVVLDDLPVTRDTLPLRLLARNPVLDVALAELRALPDDAWEHRLTEVLLRWRVEIAAQQPHSGDEEEFMQSTREVFDRFKEQVRQEGRQVLQALPGQDLQAARAAGCSQRLEWLDGRWQLLPLTA